MSVAFKKCSVASIFLSVARIFVSVALEISSVAPEISSVAHFAKPAKMARKQSAFHLILPQKLRDLGNFVTGVSWCP